jgi:hypothetical protein
MRPRCPHRCPCSVVPCVMVPSTADCPSNCRGSKLVANDSDEGYTTRTSLPLLWGWPLSRQQGSCSAGVGRGAPTPLTPQRPSMPAQQQVGVRRRGLCPHARTLHLQRLTNVLAMSLPSVNSCRIAVCGGGRPNNGACAALFPPCSLTCCVYFCSTLCSSGQLARWG